MEALGIEVIHLYGLTETGPFLTSCEWQPAWDALDVAERYRLKARQGIAQLLTDVRVMDADMREVPMDGTTVGEIVAFVGFAAVAWLLRFVAHHAMYWFVGYRVVLALVVMALLGTGVVAAV